MSRLAFPSESLHSARFDDVYRHADADAILDLLGQGPGGLSTA